ncbi:MAG: isoprenylcysteine carboxylmethyltransferase family protein [Candidatus Omnitrophica bacterium]|nr:isoprenylcysteine carboxylmethyltransferase family protein [Candidatus Omnitrophota bacterium]
MKRFFTKIRVPAGWIYFILLVVTGNIKNPGYLIWGLILIFTGEFIRTISAGVIKKNQIISSEGIYGIVRHPLYFGSCLMGLGFAVFVNNPVVWIYFLVFFTATYISAIKSEEEYLLNKFGEAYRKYQKDVPCFFPVSNIFSGNYRRSFSFSRFKENHEYKNWFIILIVLIILFLK